MRPKTVAGGPVAPPTLKAAGVHAGRVRVPLGHQAVAAAA